MTATLLLAGSVLAQGVAIAATRFSDGLRRHRWVLTAFAAMAVSVILMSRALTRGLSLAVGYGLWSGSGIVLAAATGVVVFKDRLPALHLLGLVLVVAGVATVYAAA